MADLIDKEELLCEVFTLRQGQPFPYKEAYKKLLKRIENAPTVEERKHGHWILKENRYGELTLECSVCNCIDKEYKKPNFCKYCGAVMEQES